MCSHEMSCAFTEPSLPLIGYGQKYHLSVPERSADTFETAGETQLCCFPALGQRRVLRAEVLDYSGAWVLSDGFYEAQPLLIHRLSTSNNETSFFIVENTEIRAV